ncbi:MAG: hypothetical protein WD079_05150 [Phycisphaeraceae bacterium]
MLCPYCGEGVKVDAGRCWNCTAMLDAFNRRVIQQHLGPWFFRLPSMVYRPGCSYAVLRDLVKRGSITGDTILRGPTTRQCWTYAREAPGVAHLLGLCHACGQSVDPADPSCPHCSRAFPHPDHRNYLGLDPDNHQLVDEAVRRERARAERAKAPPRPQPQPKPGQRFAMPQREDRPAADASPSFQTPPPTPPESLFELAAATSGHKHAPRQYAVPRSSKRGGAFFWILVIANVLLVIVLGLILWYAVTRDEPNGTPADEVTLAVPPITKVHPLSFGEREA